MKLTPQQQVLHEQRQQMQRQIQAKEKFSISKYKKKYYKETEEEEKQNVEQQDQKLNEEELGITAKQLEEMMIINGCDYNNQKEQVLWLPLHYFDDKTFDIKEEKQWLGESGRLICLQKEKDEYKWVEGELLDYDKDSGKFVVKYSNNRKEQKLVKLYCYFSIEKVDQFINRTQKAMQSRIYADSLIRYKSFIENMPVQDGDELGIDQIRRIEKQGLGKRLEGNDISELILEINKDYQNTMNKIIFDKCLNEYNSELLPHYLDLPKPFKPIQPYFGILQLEAKKGAKEYSMWNYKEIYKKEALTFTEIFKIFCLESILLKKEIVKSLQEVKTQCSKIVQVKLFELNISQSLRLEEFKQIQENQANSGLMILKQEWVQNLTNIIKNRLGEIQKGWFCLREIDKDNYENGKLKRYLVLIRQIMQDCLRDCIRINYQQYVKMIIEYLPESIIIKNAFEVENQWGCKKAKIGLFSIELQLNNNQFKYSFLPQSLVTQLMLFFDKLLDELTRIPDIENRVMNDMGNGKQDKYLKVPMRPQNKKKDNKYVENFEWLFDLHQELRQELQRGVDPLVKYIEQYEEFIQIVVLDHDEYIKEYDVIEKKEDEQDVIQIDINIISLKIKELNIIEIELKDKVKDYMQVGFFQVNCKEVCDFLVKKYQKLQKSLKEIIAKRAKLESKNIIDQFLVIQNKVNKKPTDIESLTEVKEFINNEVPNEMESLQAQMDECMKIFDILEDFNFKMDKEDLNKKFKILGSIKDTQFMIETREGMLEKDKLKYLENMKVSQQEFKENMDQLDKTIKSFTQYTNIDKHQEVARQVKQIQETLNNYNEEARKFNSRENLFDLPQSDYGKLQNMIKEFSPFSNLWLTSTQWFSNIDIWMNCKWKDLDAIGCEKFVDEGLKTLLTCSKYFKEKQQVKILKIAEQVREEILQFRPKVPLMVALRKQGMTDRHWKQVSDTMSKEINPDKDEDFNFLKVLELGLMEKSDKLVEIGETASKEYQIEVMLRGMQKQWEDINWDLKQYKHTYVIRGYDEIGNVLDEHILNTQQMMFSPYRKPLEQEIIDFNEALKLMSLITEEWAKCQINWMYLQPIFESPDIAKQLPGETKKFKVVDSIWKQSLNLAKQLQSVLKTCLNEGLLEKLRMCNENLDVVQKALEDYLEKKRESFPRFYFLANNDLIAILSQTKEPTAVQPHLSKVFENMTEVEFDQNKKILAMFSAEREKVDFVKPVDPNGKSVEHWMTDLQDMMKISVRHELEKSVFSYKNMSRKEWVCAHKGQCVLNGSQVHWTSEVEEAIQGGSQEVKKYLDKSNDQLQELVEIVRTKLSKQLMTTINALIVIDVHAMYVVQSLVENNIRDIGAFEWISFLRYYWYDDNCHVKCIQTVFPYAYEYLGNTPRLVITPLTDQCYMTLMGALKLNLGGAPAGPAGTGKTESTKDLAKALAIQCVVFNCSDQMDYIMVARMFKGLASSGAWCCFDEFNRINIEVLSVIAQQLQFLFEKKARGETTATFEGSEIKVLPTFSVFITMNPGYAGRTELPDNLKALFRPMAMMVPDYKLIAEIRLYSFGFQAGSELAKKMVTTFCLASESLSSQFHYDYGMRAVSSVINAAGLLKVMYPTMDEQQLLLRALRDVNVPKFLKNDLPLFENIINDLFPGVEKPKYDYGNLESAIQQVCNERNLQMTSVFLAKIYQLYDTTQIRHGLMLVGPTGGGKTKTYQVLSQALSKLVDDGYYLVECDILNPKSVKMGQLYGEFNLQTKEWTDGVLANMIRTQVTDTSNKRHWTVFDGPVDALWIESMNTVLDDNKKLCLNSGQIITLTQYMLMIFEVSDLSQASPATVSRCGMVYMEPQALTYRPYLDSWFNSLPKQLMDKISFNKLIKHLFEQYMPITLEFNRKHSVEIVETGDNDLCASLCKLLECYLNPIALQKSEKPLTNEQVDHLENILENLFFFSLIWSIGVTGNDASRIKFDAFFKENINKNSKIPFPSQNTVYDYMFDEEQKQFNLWSDQIKGFTIDPSLAYNEIMVSTSDSTRNLYLSKLLILNDKNMLITGPTGTGKTQNALLLLSKQLGQDYQYCYMAFSAQTGENQTQDTIDSKLVRRRRGRFGPDGGAKRFIVFVDDLNMPKKEKYLAQPPIEILRQYLDHQGWYDRKTLTFKILEDIILFCAMGTPGGGRTFITPRMSRHFNIVGYTELEQSIVRYIFSSLSNSFLKRMNDEVKEIIPKLIDTLLILYEEIKTVFLPTPAKCHYLFNLRDLSKVVQGVCWASLKHTTEPIHLIRLWYHEIMRVFNDRLTTEKDREDIQKMTIALAEQKLAVSQPDILNVNKIIFIDFMQGRDGENKPYCQVQDINQMLLKIVDYQEDYNSEMSFGAGKSSLNLVLFLDACEHICRITRILRQPQGNALLLGVGGSGRQSLAKLASFISNYKVIQIELVKNYGLRQWREDLKIILMSSGVENKATTFLFVDTQIIQEQQVEDINSILNSGDVANLYQQKEIDEINNACKQECVKKGLIPNKMNFYSTFLTRVKRNFHLIFCMSPIGDAFGTRVKMFPSLVNNCTLDLFTDWPEEALIGVGLGQIAENERELGIEDNKHLLVQMFKNIHKSVEQKRIEFYNQYNRNVYVTPKSYLEQLVCYQQVLMEKKIGNSNAIQRLSDGLNKLMFAEKEVSRMENELTIKQPKLAVAQKETSLLIAKIEIDKKEASEKQAVVSVEEEIANKQAKEANEIKVQAEAMVADAQRKLDQTQEDVKQLTSGHLSEIKSFKVPSETVKLVLGGVCVFLQGWIKEQNGAIIKMPDPNDQFKTKKIDDYFNTCIKYFFPDPNKFKHNLLHYDKEQISPEIVAKFEKDIRSKELFNYEQAYKANVALSYLFKWCEAMYEFDKTFRETAPLREKLENAQRIVKEKTAELKEKKDVLKKINDKIQELEELFNRKNAESIELTNDIEDCSIKLSRAQRLVLCLGDEKQRWGQDVKNLSAQSESLAGDSIIAAGMISYCGPFTSDFRQQLEKEWLILLKDLEIKHTENSRMINFMGDPVLKQYWTINCGLPKDDTSTENGIIIEKSKRWTLMIDPQTQANKFIKNMGKDRTEGFEVMKASDSTIMRTLEKAIQFGSWVLIENVGKDLDPALEPILQKQLKKEGSNYFISIGDKQIPYDTKFKFFMTTTLPNPHYSPETFAKVTIINFSITPKGLEEQMLAQVVALENSQMEIKKQEIVKKNAEDKKELLNIENGILKSLGEVKEIADVLKDENLIIQLQDSKKFAQEINQRVEDSKVTEKQIDEARESYRPVASRASLLFFCIVDLGGIDPMYQYSLQWFQNLFSMGVQNSPISNVLETRLKNLNDYFTYSLYENICRSLFEKHKLLFSFLLTVRMEFFKETLDPTEFRYFLTGPTGEIKVRPNPVSWIDQNSWPDIYKQIYGASNLFPGLEQYFYNNLDAFKYIYDSNEPENLKLPGEWDEKLNMFQKMIVLKALRSDKIVPAVQNYITSKIGKQFILNPTFDLAKCYKDSSVLTPLIFVLSAGSDPVSDYLKFWDEMNMSSKYQKKIISLGQGQGIHAENNIKEASQKGGWVLLQNCHLSINWLSELEKIVEDFSENLNKEFRLWLTSMPEPKFPISILQNGIKMTLEPPQGLRNNLLRTYANLDDKILEDCTKPQEFKKLLFGFCLFHAIIQDRRKFGPIGWNIQYDFTNEDLLCCRRQLQSLLCDYEEIPFKVINFLGARVNYGGRVTDKKDIVLITTVLRNFINEDVLKDDYKFSESGYYRSIPAINQQDYINYIEQLPLNPEPEAFGLHDNAEISNSLQQTRNLLSTILSISSKSSGKSGKSREEQIEEIAIFVQSKTPELFDEDEVEKTYPTDYNQSLNTILLQEIIKYNKLLKIMIESLRLVKLALNGRIGMSDDLNQLSNSLFDNLVPEMWSEVGFLSLKPLGSWTIDLIQRCDFFRNWAKNGTPSTFWFSGFFFPQAFITGVMQNFARKYIIAIDMLDFDYFIKDSTKPEDITVGPIDGCLVHGLFLEGCRWDYEKHQLTHSRPKELFSDLPLIYLVPRKGRDIITNQTSGLYLCPLYKVESRKGVLLTTGHSTNFVRDLELPTDLNQEIWIKAGVAAFVSLRY